MNGHFVISLDFELVWGLAGWNITQVESYSTNIKNAKTALKDIVEVFDKYNMKCTIGFVGAMNFSCISELRLDENTVIPSYQDKLYASFLSLLPYAEKELGVDLFLAESEIMFLKSRVNIELASHTFSHYYCLEKGQSIVDFEKDLIKTNENAKLHGIKLSSIIFPRNQVNDTYLRICRNHGFTHFRGMLNNVLYEPSKTSFRYSPMGALRFLDTYFNISGLNTYSIESTRGKELIDVPGSRFFRPYSKRLFFLERLKMRRIKESMVDAARNGRIYHLWWHPHNFGVNIRENILQLEEICRFFVLLQKQYGFRSSFLSEIR